MAKKEKIISLIDTIFYKKKFWLSSCWLVFVLFLIILDGGGGKGTWGKLLDTDVESHIDRNDPNYDSGEVSAVPAMWFIHPYSSQTFWIYFFVFVDALG